MFHKFFKQSLNVLKSNQRLIENTAYGLGLTASAYYYPESSRQYARSCMSLFYGRLSEEEQLAIKKDPQREQEFIEESKTNLRLIIGPPD